MTDKKDGPAAPPKPLPPVPTYWQPRPGGPKTEMLSGWAKRREMSLRSRRQPQVTDQMRRKRLHGRRAK